MDFANKLKQRFGQTLPGSMAQNLMKARRTNGEEFEFHHEGPPMQGGVALLLYPDQGAWYMPLMKRSVYSGVHSGQISLPGGKMENSDGNLIETALRETKEEIGVNVPKSEVVGSLSEIYITASHFNILPVVAVLGSKPDFIADEREVQEVITASLDDLLLSETSKEKDIHVRGYDIVAPYFDISNEVVWGATAMIINEFITIAREVRSSL